MEIDVNGQRRQVVQGLTVAELLAFLGLEDRRIAVERNLEIVPFSAWGEQRLQQGDRIEIVDFVGGG